MSIFDSLRQKMLMAAEERRVARAVAHVVRSRSYYPGTGHPSVRAYEALLSRMHGHCMLGIDNGTDALVLALKTLGVGAGDEVIVPAFCFISTASAVSWIGARPVFVDVKHDDYALDARLVEARVTTRTKAIIIAHLFGQPAVDLGALVAYAKRTGIALIEDVAQSFGAQYQHDASWNHVGTFGDIGCFSFSSTKSFSAPGNAGAILVKNKAHERTIRGLRSYGARIHYRDYPLIGTCAKLDEIHAAALVAKFPFVEEWARHRRALAARYDERLTSSRHVIVPKVAGHTRSIWHRYTVRTSERSALLKRLAAETPRYWKYVTVHYPVPLPFLEVFKTDAVPGDFPVSEQLAAEVISLPLNNYISLADVDAVADIVAS